MNRRDFLKSCVIMGAPLILPFPSFAQEAKTERIFLTIDDGPRRTHREILNQLKEKGKATFFMTGYNIERDFDLAVETINLGHDIGNHSYSHPSFSRISVDTAKREIDRTGKLIERAYNCAKRENPRLFRFPFGDSGVNPSKGTGSQEKVRKMKNFLKEESYTSFLWTIDTEDWKFYSRETPLDAREIYSRANKAREGDIVLMHDLEFSVKSILPLFTNNEDYELRLLREHNWFQR